LLSVDITDATVLEALNISSMAYRMLGYSRAID
jgi:hypothetical protein